MFYRLRTVGETQAVGNFPTNCPAKLCAKSRRMYVYGRAKSVQPLTSLHSRVNTLTKTVCKPSVATRLRDLVAGDSGFTLLETLAVMVIVGLLAAITVPQIAKWSEKEYVASLKSDANIIGNAVEAYYVDNQSYPTRPEFDTLVGPISGDLKLTPGNEAYWYGTKLPGSGWRYDGVGSQFAFWVDSSKTDSQALYLSYEDQKIRIIP